jgi:thiol:disulfide interchange protein DsbD
MLLWGALLICSGVFLGALQHLPVEASGWRKLWKGMGVILVVYGTLMLAGAAAGGRDTLQPLRGMLAVGVASPAQAQQATFRKVRTVADLERELAAAKAAGKPVMFDFYADWCVYCKQLEKETFPDPAVQAVLAEGILLKADVTADNQDDRALLARIGVPGPPAMIFYGTDGVERRNYRLLGFMPPKEFAAHARKAWQ